jgi:hypothetical protein
MSQGLGEHVAISNLFGNVHMLPICTSFGVRHKRIDKVDLVGGLNNFTHSICFYDVTRIVYASKKFNSALAHKRVQADMP